MSTFRFPIPGDEHAFEEFCLALMKEVRSLPLLQRYGRRGQRQHGVDLIDTSGIEPLFAAQCKHHDPNLELSAAELEAEVVKARGFPGRIGIYVMLTTAKKSTRTQDALRRLNEEHRKQGLFTIELLTWDEIERLVTDSSTASGLLGVDPTPGVVRAIRAELQPLKEVAQQQAAELRNTDLDEAKGYLEKGSPQMALILVERARQRWTEMSPGQRSRLCSLEADARLRLGDTKAAARLLLEAASSAPDDERSALNEIIAHELVNDDERSREQALAARHRFPTSAGAHAAVIHHAIDAAAALSAIEAVPKVIRESPDVLVAIASRRDIGAESLVAARRATEVAEGDARAWFALGSNLLADQLDRVDPDRAAGREPLDAALLDEARAAFTKVHDLASKSGHVGLQVAALTRRMAIAGLLNDAASLKADADEAIRVAPEDFDVLVAAARAALERDDSDAAVNMLRKAVMRRDNDEARFFLSVALWNRNGPGDRAEVPTLLANVARRDGPFLSPALDLVIDALLGAARERDAIALVDEVAPKLEPGHAAILRARVASIGASSDVAAVAADEALRQLSEETSATNRSKLASVLLRLGRFADALPLLEQVAVPGGDTDAGRRLVECAARLERDDIVLRYCERARELGIYDDYLLSRELPLLDRYDPPGALAVLEEFVRRAPEKHGARVHLVVLARRLGKLDLAREHLGLLPAVATVEADEGAAIVAMLQELGKGREALAFAYDLLRRHFRDHRAHRAFRDASLWASSEDKEDASPSTVQPGCAVRLAEDEGNERWIVLEDSHVDAPPLADEERPDSALARMVHGKRVGDAIVFPGPGVDRRFRVQEIVPKRVYRFRDVLNQWQFRFPDKNELWMMRVGDDGGKPDFSQLFAVLKYRREKTQEAEMHYAQHLIPLGFFGELLGTNELRAIGHIAASDRLQLRCTRGSKEDREEALAALRSASEVVIDLSAVGTLILADELEALEQIGKPIIVSHSTMLSLRALAAEVKGRKSPEGTLEDTGSGPRMRIAPDELKAAAKDFMERVIAWFEKHVRPVDALDLAKYAPADRKELERLLGLPALESAIIAAKPNRVLWTDDGVSAIVVAQKLGVRRIWTQIAFSWLADEGRLAIDRYAKLSARLIEWGYSFTSTNDGILRTAGEMCDWNDNSRLLKAVIAYFGSPEVRCATSERSDPQTTVTLTPFADPRS